MHFINTDVYLKSTFANSLSSIRIKDYCDMENDSEGQKNSTCPLLQKTELKAKIIAGRMQPKIDKLLKELGPEDELTPEMVAVIQSKVIEEVNATLVVQGALAKLLRFEFSRYFKF